MTIPETLALSYPRAAQCLDISQRALRRLHESGEIPAVQVGGGRVLFRVTDLQEYLQRNLRQVAGK